MILAGKASGALKGGRHVRLKELTTHSNLLLTILHKAGEVSTEKAGVAHWWKNVSNETVILISADILRDHADHSVECAPTVLTTCGSGAAKTTPAPARNNPVQSKNAQ